MPSVINSLILAELRELSTADYVAVFIPLAIISYVGWTSFQYNRRTIVEPKTEKVFIVGASSGIGRQIALDYSARGALVVIMGRRKAELETVRDDCEHAGASRAIAVVGDFTAVEDIVAARENIARELSGLDTLIVAAGVSSLQPLITGVAKAERDADGHFAPGAPSKDAVQRVQDVAARAMTANYVGPLLTAVTFIPMLELTSKAPAILLIASAASIIPAPTRSLYCSTKGATLLLYQSLAIEHPRIKFSNVLPATVEGNFRAGAVDAGPVRENLGSALKKDYVAKECIASVDSGKTNVILPISYRAAHALYWIYPSLVHRFAKNKYNFN